MTKINIFEIMETKRSKKEYMKEYYERNKEKILKRNKEYRENNKEKIKEYRKRNKEKENLRNKEYRENNKEKLKEYNNNYFKSYYEDNNIDLKNYQKEYRENNKEKIKEYRENNKEELKEKRRIYTKFKLETDDFFKLKYSIRKNINYVIRNKNYSKKSKTHEILGCSFEFFKTYIENKFEPWMNWGNYGLYNGEFNYGWDFDHIIPISSAETEEDVYKLNHYTNFQPLCSKINRDIKKNKRE